MLNDIHFWVQNDFIVYDVKNDRIIFETWNACHMTNLQIRVWNVSQNFRISTSTRKLSVTKPARIYFMNLGTS